MTPGDTFIPQAGDRHLTVVVAECPHEQVLIVRVTKKLDWKDQTCELVVGDHPWVRRPTLIHYGGALIGPGGRLDAQLGDALEPQAALAPEVLTRIRQGFARSPDARPIDQEFVSGRCRCARS